MLLKNTTWSEYDFIARDISWPRIIFTRRGDIDWPPRSCHLTPLDFSFVEQQIRKFFLQVLRTHGYIHSLANFFILTINILKRQSAGKFVPLVKERRIGFTCSALN